MAEFPLRPGDEPDSEAGALSVEMSALPAPFERSPREAYPDETRLTTLALFAENGSATITARLTGIPESTIRRWIEAEDGMDTVASLRVALRAQTAHKYVAMASLACDAVLERLANGDAYVDARGVTRRVPVKARDAMVIAAMSTDRHALLTGMMSSEQTIERGLRSMADKLVAAVREAAKPPESPPGDMPEVG